MEFSNRPFARLLCAGLLAVASSGANAVSVFQPNDQTVNFFNIQASSANLQLAMFDDQDTSFAGSLLNINLAGDVATFQQTIGQNIDYTVTNNANDSLTLLGSDQFILGLQDTSGSAFVGWMQPSDVTCTTTTNSCTASWSVAGTTELVVDVQLAPVPVPAAVWLFGSGLIGLTMAGRRRAK